MMRFFQICFLWLFTFVSSGTVFATTDQNTVEHIIDRHNELRSPETLEPILDLARGGNRDAIYTAALSYYWGFGTDVDRSLAFELHSLNTFQEATHIGSAKRLAIDFLTQRDGAYFDLEKGLIVLRAVAKSGDLEAQLHLALFLEDEKRNLSNIDKVEDEIIENLQLAADQASPEAHLVLYTIKLEKPNPSSELLASAIKNLKFAAENPHQLQGEAARILAIHYYQGNLVPKNDTLHLKYLEIGARNGDVPSVAFLAKAKMLGIGGDVDYHRARGLLDRARAAGFKGTNLLERQLDERIKLEREFDTFEPPIGMFENFVMALSYSNSNQTSAYDYDSEVSFGEGKQVDSSTYRFSGNVIRDPNGGRWTVNGDTIRDNNGNRFQRFGSTIRSSNGTRYSISGNVVRGSDGSRYTFSGNSVRSANGVRCKRVGIRFKCL